MAAAFTRKRNIDLIPYACGAGASDPGCALGPQYLEQAEIEKIIRKSARIADWVDATAPVHDSSLPPLKSADRKAIVQKAGRMIAGHIGNSLRQNHLPVTIAGDHSVSAYTIAALAKARKAHGKVGVLWLDAHPDLNTEASTPSGACHGMPIAALLGEGPDHMHLETTPALRPHNMAYIGVRSIDPAEQAYIEANHIFAMTVDDVQKTGIETALQMAMGYLSVNADYFVCSLDLDVFDPALVPGTGTPVEHGLGEDLILALAKLVQAYKFSLFETVEYNPEKDKDETTLALIEKIVQDVIAIA